MIQDNTAEEMESVMYLLIDYLFIPFADVTRADVSVQSCSDRVIVT